MHNFSTKLSEEYKISFRGCTGAIYFSVSNLPESISALKCYVLLEQPQIKNSFTLCLITFQSVMSLSYKLITTILIVTKLCVYIKIAFLIEKWESFTSSLLVMEEHYEFLSSLLFTSTKRIHLIQFPSISATFSSRLFSFNLEKFIL